MGGGSRILMVVVSEDCGIIRASYNILLKGRTMQSEETTGFTVHTVFPLPAKGT